MGYLIGSYRYIPRSVHQNISSLQQWITEKTIGRQIPLLQLVLLILVTRHALQPPQRRDHRQQQVQFSVLRHTRLNKQRGRPWIDAHRQPVNNHVDDILL